MKIIHYEDDKYLVLNKYKLIATFDLEINSPNDKIRLAWFFVYDDFKGKHYSKKILKEILKMIRMKNPILDIKKEKKYLVLQCFKNNKIAYNLYKSFGFEECEGIGFNFKYEICKLNTKLKS